MENQNNLSECNLEELTYTDLQEIEGGVVVMALLGAAAVINFMIAGAAIGYAVHRVAHKN